MTTKPTRREFLGTAAAATAAVAWPNRQTRAAAAAQSSPNSTINLGLIGCGGEGRAVMLGHLKCPNTRIVGVCDVNEERLGLGVSATGNNSIATYRDFRKLLDNKDIDAVIVGTNDHWHCLCTIMACQAGKHVYVEKPLGTSIGEGRAAVKAARKYDRVVQLGTQQRSWPHYQQAAEVIQSGRLGEISEVKVWDYDYLYPGFGSPPDADPPKEFGEQYWDFWLGPSPKRPYNPNRFINHGTGSSITRGPGRSIGACITTTLSTCVWVSPLRFRRPLPAGCCASRTRTLSGPTRFPASANTGRDRWRRKDFSCSTPSAAVVGANSVRTASCSAARRLR